MQDIIKHELVALGPLDWLGVAMWTREVALNAILSIKVAPNDASYHRIVAALGSAKRWPELAQFVECNFDDDCFVKTLETLEDHGYIGKIIMMYRYIDKYNKCVLEDMLWAAFYNLSLSYTIDLVVSWPHEIINHVLTRDYFNSLLMNQHNALDRQKNADIACYKKHICCVLQWYPDILMAYIDARIERLGNNASIDARRLGFALDKARSILHDEKYWDYTRKLWQNSIHSCCGEIWRELDTVITKKSPLWRRLRRRVHSDEDTLRSVYANVMRNLKRRFWIKKLKEIKLQR